MRNRKRMIAVYKGDKHLVTGTSKEVAEFLGITEDHAIYLTRPVNHRRNTGGNRRVGFYVDSSPLSDKLHDFLITVCRLYEKEQRPLGIIETGVEAKCNRNCISSTASVRYRKLLKYGYVKKVDVEGPGVLYVPTQLGIEYCTEFELEEVTL